MEKTLYTIGHSTLAADAFFDRLSGGGVRALIDIRRFPGSRRHPQFGRDALSEACAARGIAYEHRVALGGRRTARPDSPNVGLRNPQFRGYADHMQTAGFRAAMSDVFVRAAAMPTAVLCAESVWWRCHRSLLADYAVLHGWRVLHLGAKTPAPHKPLAPVEARDGSVVYPGTSEPDMFANRAGT